MESGFGQNLEGFLIKGNLSLAPAELPHLQGDGSIEGSGTLYINKITEYDTYNGIDIQNVLFKNNVVYIPYNTPSLDVTSGSIVLEGGISIKNTTQSTGLTAGGAMTIAGGATIMKNLNVGGILNMNGGRIINVPLPSIGTDGVNKDYVDSVANKLSGNFTTGQVIIGASNGDAIEGFSNFTYDGNTLVLSSTQPISGTAGGGALICYGGAEFKDDIFVDGDILLNDTTITNVADPVQPTDATNKRYVDSITFGNIVGSAGAGQVVIGTTDPNAIASYSSLLYDGSTLTLSNTQNGSALTEGNALVMYGGASIYGSLQIGGTVNASGNYITNVLYPVNDSDAATKQYVDDNRLQGNFTTGQLIIAQTNGDAIRGFDNLSFDITDGTTGTLNLNSNTAIFISNTENAIGLGTGGTLTTLGGASFEKNVYIGDGLDVNLKNITNVATPANDYDAVNKLYVDAAIANIDCCDGGGGNTSDNVYENTFVLNNNVFLPQDIPEFTFDADIRAFISYIYVEYDNDKCALYTIRGINKGTSWYISPTFIGEDTNVNFFIREDNGQGILQYTNLNSAGVVTIKFRTTTEIYDPISAGQSQFTLSNNISTFTDIPGLLYLNSDYDSVKLVIYISDDDNGKYGLYFLNCILKENEWALNTHSIGNIQNIRFRMFTQNGIGRIQYTNVNSIGSHVLRMKQIKISKALPILTLNASTFTPANIDSVKFVFDTSKTNFQLTLHVEVPDSTPPKHALYELEGFICNNVWKLNSRYIGDTLGVHFYIESSGGTGYIRYTNTNPIDANIRFLANTPTLFQPLQVPKGGTGNTFLTPYSVLRGNGVDPIIGTADFIYKDYQLILGSSSSILLENTTSAVNLSTGGTFTTLGGASITKNVLIGDTLTVKDIDITPSVGDITAERGFFADNNISIPEDVVNFSFANLAVKAFSGMASVTVTSDPQSNGDYDILDALFELKGIRKKNGWILSSSYIGDNIGLKFSITSSGQIQYTSENIPYHLSTKIKFRALTTTV